MAFLGLEAVFDKVYYTAGPNLDGAVSWFLNPAAKASAHLVIGRDGEVVQMVAFNKRAWHAGKSDSLGIRVAVKQLNSKQTVRIRRDRGSDAETDERG